VSDADDHCRIDVWLWRARFCKTRSLAARLVEDGRVRLWRGEARTRLDKPSRTIRPGDRLILDFGDRPTVVDIAALGVRRGPAPEARTLYSVAPAPSQGPDAEPPGGSGQQGRFKRDFGF
jgi:ribosome-associated heat shock protein Hsp15